MRCFFSTFVTHYIYMPTTKIYKLSQVMPATGKYDSVKKRKAESCDKVNFPLLQRCEQAWENLRQARETAERTRRYCNGDQWGDLITYKNQQMTERDYIQRIKGQVPLTNNIMSSILLSIVGVRGKQETEPVCFARTRDSQALSDMMSATLQTNWQTTRQENLHAHQFRDFLTDGFVMSREAYRASNGKADELDAWTDSVPLNYAFFEAGSDPRHNDLDLIGMLHDISPEDLFFQFARPEYGMTIDKLCEIFSINHNEQTGGIYLNDRNKIENVSFFCPSESRKVRVIEVWTKEVKSRYQCFDPLAESAGSAYYRCEIDDKKTIAENKATNASRKKLYESYNIPEEERAYITMTPITDVYWYYTFMAPDGTILCEGETPYDNKDHPFTLKLYPYSNGEIHPFMTQVIPQQRYINRLVMTQDMAAKAAAKGHTIVPISTVPDGDLAAFAENMTSFDGITFYELDPRNPNARPDVLTSNVQGIGTNEMLQLQINLIRDISNVSGALQGKTPSAGTSASRYALEAQNATTSLYAVLKDFSIFSECVAEKKLEVIKQYYEQGRLVFDKGNDGLIEYDALAAEDVKFRVSIREAAATAAYAQEVNESLNALLDRGAITIEEYLTNVKLPFADKLLQTVQARIAREQEMQQLAQQTMQNGQVPGANQETVAQVEKALGRPN